MSGAGSLLQSLELHPVRIPMKHRFRRVEYRDAVLIRGPAGWGEFSPFPDYPPGVTTRWLAAALELACGLLPAPGRTSVPVNVTIPVVAPDLAARLVRASGATTAKVKVGDPSDDDKSEQERLAAVREALGESGRLRIDVNAAWDLETAVSRLNGLAHFDLEYVEQPVATIEEMSALRHRVSTPLAIDELVRQSPRPIEIIESGIADFLILKVQPMGGVSRVLELAGRSPVPVIISSALETSVGMYAGALAASRLAQHGYAFGLGTVSLLAGDPTKEPLIPEGGMLEVRRPEPDPALVSKWRPDRDHAAEMLRRVRAAAEMLT
ncbi:MAG: o-succinylbenzoate synthase [Acidimicrobiia bacterium]|nr:o-succinylbenzoate synthase [Acidimicrobiia bacterium]